MADKTIGSLPQAQSVDDSSLFVCEQQGTAMKTSGAQWKGFAVQAVSQYVEPAQQAAQQAQQAAQQATQAVSQIGTAVEDTQANAQAAQEAKEAAEAAQGLAETAKTEAEAAASGVAEDAQAAEQAKEAAIAAQQAAETAGGNAETSATGAATSASQASQSASDASGSATAAAGSATTASQAASNAQSAQTLAETAKAGAEAARDAIVNMLVEAITLETGQPATVSKSLVDQVYKLTFGLPKGKTGATGATGPQGVSVESIQLTNGNHAPGTTDTYTMYDSNDDAIGTFTVYNGANGAGAGDFMADGSVPMTGPLNMGGNKITNLGAPGADTDAVRKSDLDAVAAEVDGILDGTTPAHLAPATDTKIGGVIIGDGLSVEADGTLSADDQLPAGGTQGQVLTQGTTGPEWQDAPSGLPDGGTDGQVLTKTSDGVAWEDATEAGVTSFKGRTGAVTPQEGDYTADMVGARPDTWTPSAADVGAVPTSRTVNGKALSQDISLSASDVGARPDTWTPSAADVGALPTQTGTQGQLLGFTANNVVGAVAAPTADSLGAVPTSRTVNGKALSQNITLDAEDVGAMPPPNRLTAILSASRWSGNSQTITVNGVITNTSAQDIDISCVDKASADAWAAGGVWCSNPTQANRLTFTCTTPPTANIILRIRLWEVG